MHWSRLFGCVASCHPSVFVLFIWEQCGHLGFLYSAPHHWSSRTHLAWVWIERTVQWLHRSCTVPGHEFLRSTGSAVISGSAPLTTGDVSSPKKEHKLRDPNLSLDQEIAVIYRKTKDLSRSGPTSETCCGLQLQAVPVPVLALNQGSWSLCSPIQRHTTYQPCCSRDTASEYTG